LILDGLASRGTVPLAVDHGRLGLLLGTLPGGPCLPFDAVKFFQFLGPNRVEVPLGRLPPFGLDDLQIARNGGLRDLELLGDGRLRPALRVQVGDLLAAAAQGDQRLAASAGHYQVPWHIDEGHRGRAAIPRMKFMRRGAETTARIAAGAEITLHLSIWRLTAISAGREAGPGS